MKLGDRLMQTEQAMFAGRGEMLALLDSHASGSESPYWLHLYGQGGIGKTALLRYFQAKPAPYARLYVDGRRGIRGKEDVLHQILALLDELADQQTDIRRLLSGIARQNGLVLLLDTFEEWRSAEEWLEPWLRRLDLSIRIVTAGRHPLTGTWLRDGWRGVIRSVPVPELNPVEVQAYAFNRGIEDPERQLQLHRFSGGVPMAMTLAAEVILGKGAEAEFSSGDRNSLIVTLMEELVRGLDTGVRFLLEAASVLWRFNEELLSCLLDGSSEAHDFDRLIRLPFVTMEGTFWMLHDAARAWVQDDLIRRKPESYESMRKKGLARIREEERANPRLRLERSMDKLHLHEHPLVRNTCFYGHVSDLELRACKESDLPAVQSLYLRYLRFVLPDAPDDKHLTDSIFDVWHADPSSLVTVWRENRLIAFYGFIPLDTKMLAALAREPMLRAFVRGWKPVPHAYLSCYIGIEPELETLSRAFILNAIMTHYSAAKYIVNFTCLREWFSVFESCGFGRAEWADALTAAGTEYRAFTLDLTTEDFLTKLDRMLADDPAAPEEEPLVPSTSPASVNDLKRLLDAWSQAPFSPACAEELRRQFPALNPLQGAAIRERLKAVIHELSNEPANGEMHAKLLTYAYLQRIRPHERIAERLHLSPATYYRYLNRALARLLEYLAAPSV